MMTYVVRFRGARQVLVGVGGFLAVTGTSLLAQALTSAEPDRPGGSSVSRLADGQAVSRPAEAPESVALYRQHCIECHDADGRGESARETGSGAPDFTDPRWQGKRADHELAGVIWGGKKSMPAMKSKLTRANVDALVILVRGFRGGRQRISEEDPAPEPAMPVPHPDPPLASARPPERRPAEGAGNTRSGQNLPGSVPTAFQQLCVRCHGQSGDGASRRSAFRSIPDFTSIAWQEQHSEGRLKLSILEGKGSAMPPFGGRIDEPAATELVTFVRSLAGIGPAKRENRGVEFDNRFQRLMNDLEELKREYRLLERTASSGALRRNVELTDHSAGQANAREERVARAVEKR